MVKASGASMRCPNADSQCPLLFCHVLAGPHHHESLLRWDCSENIGSQSDLQPILAPNRQHRLRIPLRIINRVMRVFFRRCLKFLDISLTIPL